MSQTLFSNQAKERPDPSRPGGRKIVYDASTETQEVPQLSDGRFDGRGPWSRSEISKAIHAGEGYTHNQLALWALYTEGRVSRRSFADICQEKTGKPSWKLPARIAELRQVEEAPPIKTDEDAEPTEWHIPQVSDVS